MSKSPKGSKVQGSQGPKDQDISNSHSNTSLTLKKVHLVLIFFIRLTRGKKMLKLASLGCYIS